jgi:hypothetical protein
VGSVQRVDLTHRARQLAIDREWSEADADKYDWAVVPEDDDTTWHADRMVWAPTCSACRAANSSEFQLTARLVLRTGVLPQLV